MEDDTTRSEPSGIDPEENQEPELDAASRLRELEEEAERLREQIRAEEEERVAKKQEEREEPEAETPSSPAGKVEHPEAVPEEPETSFEAKAEAENLVRQAHVAKMRGQNREYMDLLMKAEQAAPNFPPVLEALGDALAEKSRWKDAQSVYGRANALDKGNVAIERKYAQAVLKASIPIESLLMGQSASLVEDAGNAKVAAVLSFFFPGVGQMVLGEVPKGIGFLVVWLGAWAVALLIPDGISGLAGMAGTRSGRAEPNMIVLLPLFVAIVTWLMSIYDANSRAKRIQRKTVERPKPPVDLPFE